ncbi:uncharacterized protein LOC141922118 isoform X2 [Strix aluco]|uniref:uncharacterized protein LOC141922118 isoform X2 n=1 Tax=Strix aluco TaxID=111821 RepID=UPI003DA6B4F8
MNMSQQGAAAATKTNQILGCICRSITPGMQDVIIPLYSVLVRPHLQYCVQFWSPEFKKDMNRLKRVQRTAMKMIKGLENLLDEERLKEKRKRLRGDLITVFQYIKGGSKEERGSLFTRSPVEQTRGHGYKLHQERFHLNVREIFYSENNYSMEQPPQGHGGVPVAGGFQHVAGQGAGESHLGSLSHERLEQTIFCGPFQPGLLCDSVMICKLFKSWIPSLFCQANDDES